MQPEKNGVGYPRHRLHIRCPPSQPILFSTMKTAFLSNGSLYLSGNGSDYTEHLSDFAQQVRERHQRIQERHSWKSDNPSGEALGYNLWNRVEERDNHLPMVQILSVCTGLENDLFYFLSTPSVGGLFRYDPEEQHERRVFHKEDLILMDLAHHPEREELACSVPDDMGNSLAVVSNRTFHLDFLTEGDSVDRCPSWIPGTPEELVYQTAGIGLNQDHSYSHLAPYSIVRLNISTAQQEDLLGDPEHDYMNPQMDAEGNLYCIRRPYFRGGFRSHGEALKDFLLIPFRLLKAIYGFLDAFSRLFGKQTLTNAATGEKREVNGRDVYLKGVKLDANVDKQEGKETAVVPDSWKLIRKSAEGNIDVLASHVGDFRLTASGHILWSDGRRLHLYEDGVSQKLYSSKQMMEQVLPLP